MAPCRNDGRLTGPGPVAKLRLPFGWYKQLPSHHYVHAGSWRSGDPAKKRLSAEASTYLP